MVHRHVAVAEAYAVLGLEEGTQLDVVKSKYKQIALRTHPDKNPNNPDATAEFQRVGEAYNTLLKHLEKPSPSSRRPRPSGFTSFNADDDEGDDDDEYDDYYSDDDYDPEEEMAFYMFLFEQFMRGASSRNSHARYRKQRQEPQESPQQYAERLRKSREEQILAEERRKRAAEERKARQERERERERLAAEERQKAKAEEKKAQMQAQKQKAQKVAWTLQQKVQALRSATFSAARAGDAVGVKKGVWEDEVDVTGGEVKSGCEQLVSFPPDDAQETLLHIAAKQGNRELLEWLDAHSADAEERNSHGFTAFHAGLHNGQISVVNYFFETYDPKKSDYKAIYDSPSPQSIISLAVESLEPEVVWIILDKGLANAQDISQSWTWITSNQGREALKKKHGRQVPPKEQEKFDDIVKLLMRFGGFTPPPTPSYSDPDELPALPFEHLHKQKTRSKQSQLSPPQETPPTTPVYTSTPSQRQQQNPNDRGRGRGRGRVRGRGRGRGGA